MIFLLYTFVIRTNLIRTFSLKLAVKIKKKLRLGKSVYFFLSRGNILLCDFIILCQDQVTILKTTKLGMWFYYSRLSKIDFTK